MGASTFFSDPPPAVRRVIRVVTAIELSIGCLALVLMFALVLVQAGQRYLPFQGWSFTGELALFCLVWLTFVTAGVLVTSDSHIAIEVIDAAPSPIVRRVVRVFASLVVAAAGLGLTVQAWDLVGTQGVISSPAMGMPMSWLYAISIIGFISTTIRALIAAARFAVLGAPEREDDTTAAPAPTHPGGLA
ncbi:TRAP transporter small permease [Aeromicrobium sp. CF4.19]|uniref:TRAP transporter small permease n=1 Tax=Aeromicrobium sp. CF4.19 TaxID=3373082 RepID=UPI003EE6D372